jgi:hypothetical protein
LKYINWENVVCAGTLFASVHPSFLFTWLVQEGLFWHVSCIPHIASTWTVKMKTKDKSIWILFGDNPTLICILSVLMNYKQR